MSEIYIIAVPGTVAHESLMDQKREQAEGASAETAIRVAGKDVTAISCDRKELERLKGMPLCADDFTAYRRDHVGRVIQIYPSRRSRRRKLQLSVALQEGLVTRGMPLAAKERAARASS